MSESDVKVLLKSIKKLKAKKEILSCVKKEDDEYEKLSKNERIQRKALKRIREIIENSELEQLLVNYI